jgi:hypothetical protein
MGSGYINATGLYYGLTVNEALHTAFVNGVNVDGSFNWFISYAGSDGEYDTVNTCEVIPSSCGYQMYSGAYFSLGGTMEGALTVSPGTIVRAG